MANFGSANGATILTVPANRRWVGTVSISATATGSAGDGTVTAHPSVTVSGAGATDWGDGDTVVAVALALAPVSLTALTGSAVSASQTSGRIVIHARANPVSLILNLPARITGNAFAAGEML